MMRTSSLRRHPETLRRLWRGPPRTPRRQYATHGNDTRTGSHHDASADGFFAQKAPFEGFGLDRSLVAALVRHDIHRASHIQAKGIPSLMAGRDVVLAAETGSGKTLAYLLPLLTHILHDKEQLGKPSPSSVTSLEGDSSLDEDLIHQEEYLPKKQHRYAWVLCPSVDLCQQVQSVINSLSSDVAPIVSEISPDGLSRYTQRPDVLLGTPGSLLTTITDMHKTWRDRILDTVGYIVVDEADLMLTGSYRAQIDHLLQMLYLCERSVAVHHLSSTLNISQDAFLALPRDVRRAGIRGGVRGMIEAGYKPPKKSSNVPLEQPFWRRQVILAGATIPSLGTKNVRDEIQKLFPTAEIVSTANLHKTSPQLHYDWIHIEPHQKHEALLDTIQQDTSFETGVRGKILVFAKDVPSVVATTDFLSEHDLICIPYHKKLGGHYRRANLQRFRKEEGVVMVCTDGMSRGMDIHQITHVIQADFASSAIAFVHRVGRTGRVGRSGKVTCLCTEADKDLADAIRDCIEEGTPIEGAFSRNRSFRKKMRRYGTFIPRGTAPATEPSCDEMGCLI